MACRHVYSHRLAFALGVAWPGPGVHVLHRCDNPPCCNPRHLFAGSQTVNSLDMWAKGRGRTGSVKGSARHAAKMTETSVALARERFTGGQVNVADLARENGVSWHTMAAALGGKTWRHI